MRTANSKVNDPQPPPKKKQKNKTNCIIACFFILVSALIFTYLDTHRQPSLAFLSFLFVLIILTKLSTNLAHYDAVLFLPFPFSLPVPPNYRLKMQNWIWKR